jgi:aminoglycoside 3-N-acetyltransferase
MTTGADGNPALTRERLAQDLRDLGVAPGMTLLVHASLRATGPVAGPVDRAVLGALRDALGPDGTLVVPAFTEANSDTSSRYREEVRGMTEEEAAAHRAAMPAFDPERTPSQGMGRLAETVRRSPGAVRSRHPQTSFAALGPAARELLADHDETCHLGERSPMARLYERQASILLIDVGYDVCSAFHLAEYRVPYNPRRVYRCVVARDGRPEWVSYQDANLDDSDFATLGAAFEKAGNDLPRSPVRSGKVGWAPARLLPVREAVDFAVVWLAENRRWCTPDSMIVNSRIP